MSCQDCPSDLFKYENTRLKQSVRLRLAKRFGFVIFEDDAYCFLNFEENPLHRARSYLALELEINGETGRVIRFDSLSKIVSAGMRLGVLTAPASVVQRVVKITANIKYVPQRSQERQLTTK